MIKIPQKLTTERLILRPFQSTDKEPFLEFMQDEEATKYLNFTQDQKTPEGASQLFNFIVDAYNSDEPVFSLAVELKKNGYIGSYGLSHIKDSIYECYYSLNREFWGNGYATEAMKRLITYGFQELNIEEIRAYMSPENPNSVKVAEKIGMKFIGIKVHPVFENEGKLYRIKNKNR